MDGESELTSPGQDKGLFQRLSPTDGADEASGDVEDPVDAEAKDDDDAGRDQLSLRNYFLSF